MQVRMEKKVVGGWACLCCGDGDGLECKKEKAAFLVQQHKKKGQVSRRMLGAVSW